MWRKMTKKNRVLRQTKLRVLKRQSLGVLVPGMIFMFYPFVPWLIELGGGKAGIASGCETFPLTPLTIIFGLGYGGLILLFLPLLFGWTKSAIYMLFFGALGIGVFVGIWWLILGNVFVLCKEQPVNDIIILIGLFSLFLTTVLVFFLYQRKVTKKVLDINSHAYNFETMEYAYLAPIIRPDGKENSQVGVWMISAGFVGLLLVKLPIAEWLDIAPLGSEWMMFGIGLFVGYFFLGYLGIGQLYLVWLIHKKCKAAGRTMVVKELL